MINLKNSTQCTYSITIPNSLIGRRQIEDMNATAISASVMYHLFRKWHLLYPHRQFVHVLPHVNYRLIHRYEAICWPPAAIVQDLT